MKGHEKNCKIFKNIEQKRIKIKHFNSEIEEKSIESEEYIDDNKHRIKLNKQVIIKNIDNNKFKSNYESLKELNRGKIFLENFVLFSKKLIGIGAFVQTYFGYDLTNLEEVAIKINKEKIKTTTSFNELQVLIKAKNIIGFPKIKGICKLGGNDVIIQELLGPSLKKLINFYGKPFLSETIFLIGIEILQRLKDLHKLNYLHNDLKPSNFSWGIFKNNKIIHNDKIFLIDFGL